MRRLWIWPTCCAPSSVQQKSQFLRPVGIARSALEMVGVQWDVRVGEEDLEAHPALERVESGLREGVGGQERRIGELAREPGLERSDSLIRRARCGNETRRDGRKAAGP